MTGAGAGWFRAFHNVLRSASSSCREKPRRDLLRVRPWMLIRSISISLPRSTSHQGSEDLLVMEIERFAATPSVRPSIASRASPSPFLLLCFALENWATFTWLQNTSTSASSKVLLAPGISMRTKRASGCLTVAGAASGGNAARTRFWSAQMSCLIGSLAVLPPASLKWTWSSSKVLSSALNARSVCKVHDSTSPPKAGERIAKGNIVNPTMNLFFTATTLTILAHPVDKTHANSGES